jgi:hypothetical protein
VTFPCHPSDFPCHPEERGINNQQTISRGDRSELRSGFPIVEKPPRISPRAPREIKSANNDQTHGLSSS